MLKTDNEVRALIVFGFVLVLGGTIIYDQSKAARQTRTGESGPAHVMIIRHAEDPGDDKTKDPRGLSDAGELRATSLHKLFEDPRKDHSALPRPDFIFAATSGKDSARSELTVSKLPGHLTNVAVNTSYKNDDWPKLVHDLLTDPKYAGKNILISWHHSNASKMVKEFKATPVPKHWPDDVYDRVWMVSFDKQGKATFEDLPQDLLPKDAKK